MSKIFARVQNLSDAKPSAIKIYHVYAQSLSHVQVFVAPRTVFLQAPLSMEFSRQEYWVGCYFLERSVYIFGMLHACSFPHGLGPKNLSYEKWPVCTAKSFLSGRYLPPSQDAARLSFNREMHRDVSELPVQVKTSSQLSFFLLLSSFSLGRNVH